MKRAELEHLIGAAATIADDDEIIVIGSQAVLGQFPDAPDELLVSTEADIYPKNKPELADLIDGSIGELSMFHDTFGYYAQGVGETTATLPEGWQERLVPVRGRRTRGATGWCLEVHDLVIAKLCAGREKDIVFAEVAARHALVDERTLSDRLARTRLPDDLRPHVEARLRAMFPR